MEHPPVTALHLGYVYIVCYERKMKIAGNKLWYPLGDFLQSSLCWNDVPTYLPETSVFTWEGKLGGDAEQIIKLDWVLVPNIIYNTVCDEMFVFRYSLVM